MDGQRIVVFLGPSLGREQAAAILPADYRPPVAMGDVLRAVRERPNAIAIIDGVFERVPAVWHKEILYALAEGIPVYGASSMGALRAAELAAFGMRGVGRIFEAYRDGQLEDDDEVAVAHASAESGYRPLSDPMVNIREGARLAREAGVIGETTADAIVTAAKAKFYPDRSWPMLLSELARAEESGEEIARLRAFLPKTPDLKGSDAVALLEELRDAASRGIPPHRATFDFEPTLAWQRVVGCESEVVARVDRSALGRHVRLLRDDRKEVLRECLFDYLVGKVAFDAGIAPRGRSVPRDSTHLVAREADPDALARDLDDLANQLLGALGSRLDAVLPAVLARRGEVIPAARDVADKWAKLAARQIDRPDLSDAGVSAETLSDWYEERFRPMGENVEAHARDLGFGSWEELVVEIVAQRMHEMSPRGDAQRGVELGEIERLREAAVRHALEECARGGRERAAREEDDPPTDLRR